MSSFRYLLGSLGAVGSLWGHFFEPLGHLGHEKSPKGAPKAPKGLPKVSQKKPFLGVVCITRISKKCKKTPPKKHLLGMSTLHNKCLQSVAPAMLLDVATRICTGFYVYPHNSSVHACHTFEAFLLSKDLKKTPVNPPKGVPKWSPTEVLGGSKSMAGGMF